MPSQNLQNLRALVAFQILIGATFTGAICSFVNLQLGASFAVGAGLMLVNLLLLGWSTWRMFAKKSIAWTTMIIVIKYAVLLGSIFVLARSSWFSLVGAGLGIASFLIAVLAMAFFQHKKEKI